MLEQVVKLKCPPGRGHRESNMDTVTLIRSSKDVNLVKIEVESNTDLEADCFIKFDELKAAVEALGWLKK